MIEKLQSKDLEHSQFTTLCITHCFNFTEEESEVQRG